METFSRGQQVVVLLIIFGMTLIYFYSINQPSSFLPLPQGGGRGEVGVRPTLDNQAVQPALPSNNSSFIPKPSSFTKKLSGAQLMTLNKRINLNTATAKDLEAISGIGPKTAEKIIEYRKEHGEFAQIEDIMNVKGIKDKKFEKIKRYLTIRDKD